MAKSLDGVSERVSGRISGGIPEGFPEGLLEGFPEGLDGETDTLDAAPCDFFLGSRGCGCCKTEPSKN